VRKLLYNFASAKFIKSYTKRLAKLHLNEWNGSVADWMKCRLFSDNHIWLPKHPMDNVLTPPLMIIGEVIVV